ncbi:B3 domain-containing transcription factor VRN1 [Senna tora]|uniref:B3 domain-containing transcription factor VRN1 n=1 Tax=Senna tora TaxID=362788 RepID=A0A834SPM6_9FABA|nr:B3 domain-containing transcription factor VRN1 [Senna tora]
MAFPPNLTLFLKPILSDCLRLRDKLMIPQEFVKKYGGDVLPDTAFLKLPDGAEWEVKLEKRGGDQVWIVKGWEEFAEYYSLYDGRMLVFGYDHSASRFHVLIFDLMTYLEIQYPSNGNTQSEASTERGSLCTNDDEAVLPCLQPCKRKRVTEEEGGHEVDNDLHHSTKKFKGDGQGIFDSNFLKSKVVKENSALERANAFKSQYPSFVWVAKQSYIHSTANFAIPSNFARSFLGSKENGESTNLVDLDGRVWVGKYVIREKKTKTAFELSSAGFRALAKANDLKVGDVCVFELMGGTTITFQVLIFRNTDDSNTRTEGQSREVNTEEQSKRLVEIKTEITCSDNEAFEISETLQLPPRNPKFTEHKISEGAAFDNFNSQNPFFQITIGKSHSQGIPVRFVKHLKVGENLAELKVDELRRWSVKIMCSGEPIRYCYFSAGWNSFVKQNHLQVGDACSFELISNGSDDKMIMRVCIFKHSS